jgi:hypothetical protein
VHILLLHDLPDVAFCFAFSILRNPVHFKKHKSGSPSLPHPILASSSKVDPDAGDSALNGPTRIETWSFSFPQNFFLIFQFRQTGVNQSGNHALALAGWFRTLRVVVLFTGIIAFLTGKCDWERSPGRDCESDREWSRQPTKVHRETRGGLR